MINPLKITDQQEFPFRHSLTCNNTEDQLCVLKIIGNELQVPFRLVINNLYSEFKYFTIFFIYYRHAIQEGKI